MSDFAQNLESGFRQYIYPCLTGMAFALVVLLGIVLFFSAYCSACRPRRGSVEWICGSAVPGAAFPFRCTPWSGGTPSLCS